MTQWVYPDQFDTINEAANWIAVASTICCLFLLVSWAVLPVDKTYRHYLSICLTTGVIFMNVCSPCAVPNSHQDTKQNFPF